MTKYFPKVSFAHRYKHVSIDLDMSVTQCTFNF